MKVLSEIPYVVLSNQSMYQTNEFSLFYIDGEKYQLQQQFYNYFTDIILPKLQNIGGDYIKLFMIYDRCIIYNYLFYVCDPRLDNLPDYFFDETSHLLCKEVDRCLSKFNAQLYMTIYKTLELYKDNDIKQLSKIDEMLTDNPQIKGDISEMLERFIIEIEKSS